MPHTQLKVITIKSNKSHIHYPEFVKIKSNKSHIIDTNDPDFDRTPRYGFILDHMDMDPYPYPWMDMDPYRNPYGLKSISESIWNDTTFQTKFLRFVKQ